MKNTVDASISMGSPGRFALKRAKLRIAAGSVVGAAAAGERRDIRPRQFPYTFASVLSACFARLRCWAGVLP